MNNIKQNHADSPLPAYKQHEERVKKYYFYALQFFKERETFHQKAASWYFNYSRQMEAKAHHHLDLAENAYSNRGHYRDLLVMAELARGAK